MLVIFLNYTHGVHDLNGRLYHIIMAQEESLFLDENTLGHRAIADL